MIATTSFSSGDLEALVGKHPAVVLPGVIQQGTRLWSDDPIVLAHPTMFVNADIIPGTNASPAPDGASRPQGPEWVAIVRAYRKWLSATPAIRPTQAQIAELLGMSEGSLRDRLRPLGIKDWRRVHALVLSDP